jgi:putative flippase GtrA
VTAEPGPPGGRARSRLAGLDVRQIFRFYQAAVINTLFGFGCYAALVVLGMDRYVAQSCAQLAGTIFNYFTYSRYVFRGIQGSIWRFAAVYLLNWGVNVALLAALSHVIANPYLAGLITVGLASVINYLALKFTVFVDRR